MDTTAVIIDARAGAGDRDPLVRDAGRRPQAEVGAAEMSATNMPVISRKGNFSIG
jgi:hypothetical protein